jgi:pimeloyl-ACP methyl ester carboxylesterase
MAHDSTVDWAHDVDALRLALGVSRITFYGFSYGTYLGQVYATLYPQHVRRMILDSNIDPRGDGLHVMLSMAGPVQRNLGFWFRWVARHHRTYHLGSTPAAVQRRFNATQRALAQHPAGGVVGPAEWVDVFFLTSFIQPDAYWPYLADVFQQWAVNHKAAPLVQAYEFNAEDTTGDNGYATSVAVRCMDSPWPTDWGTWRQRTWEQSHRTPFVAWGNSWFVMPCRTWPSSVTSRVLVDGHDVPALILDDRFDGSIAYSADLAVRARFPHSAFVTVRRGLAHTDSFANPCEHRWVTRYLGNGTLPHRHAGRRADFFCQAPARPTPG